MNIIHSRVRHIEMLLNMLSEVLQYLNTSHFHYGKFGGPLSPKLSSCVFPPPQFQPFRMQRSMLSF